MIFVFVEVVLNFENIVCDIYECFDCVFVFVRDVYVEYLFGGLRMFLIVFILFDVLWVWVVYWCVYGFVFFGVDLCECDEVLVLDVVWFLRCCRS